MKKILFIHYNFYHKDRWGRTFPLAKAASQCGLDVTLLTNSKKKGISVHSIEEDGVKILIYKDILPNLMIHKGFALTSLFLRIWHVLRHHYDYVYIDCGEGINTGWPGKIAQWKGSILISEWGDLLGKGGYYDHKPRIYKILYGWYFLWAELYFRKSANYTIVLSSMMKEHAIKRGIDEKRIKIVPGGASVDLVNNDYKSKKLLGLSDNIITLGYIGINKGELLDLMPLIEVIRKNKNFKNRFKIITFGKTLSIDILEKYQLNEIIINCGWLNFYEDYSLAQCVDIYILMKSTYIKRNSMGWPNKLGDYMALGRPVLLNLYGDIANFVSQHPNGFITIKLSEHDIEEQLQNILNNKFNLKNMGVSNRKVAENEISWKCRMEKLLSEINGLDS